MKEITNLPSTLIHLSHSELEYILGVRHQHNIIRSDRDLVYIIILHATVKTAHNNKIIERLNETLTEHDLHVSEEVIAKAESDLKTPSWVFTLGLTVVSVGAFLGLVAVGVIT